MGTASNFSNCKELALINFSNLRSVIQLMHRWTSENRLASSVLELGSQWIRAFSVKMRCAQAKTENKCPPNAWNHGGPKETRMQPPGFSMDSMTRRVSAGFS